MSRLSRRDFLAYSAAGTAGFLSACQDQPETPPAPATLANVGIGLFTIPFLLQQDFPGTLRRLAEIGYRELEFFGPYEFSAQEAKDYWAPIADQLGFSQSGYFGNSPTELRTILDNTGLSSPSMHTDLVTLENHVEALAEACNEVGHQYAGIAAIPDDLRDNLDDYKRMADRFNAIGARLGEYGIRMLYHNHGYGLVEMEGEIPFQVVLDRTDPDLVAMELDVYWFTAGRADIPAYLESYPGRFKLMHVKDMTEMTHFAGDGGKPGEWMELFPKMADAGAGVLDLSGMIKAAVAQGMDHFYLEKDLAADPDVTLQASYEFLSSIEV